MKSLKKQRGLTMISWIFVAAGIAFIMLVLIKVLPVYMDNMAVKGALKALRDDDSMKAATKEQIIEAFMKRINLNGITDVERANVTVVKDPNHMKVDVDYGAQRQMIANIYVYVVFNESVEKRF